MTTLDDPSTSYRSIRITSSTSIQTAVTTCLLHLADPSSSPLTLHTLPSPSNTSSGKESIAILPKNTHPALCKLISIVEITKREFEEHQKVSWRLQDAKERKSSANKATTTSKRKKRAREEEEGPEEDNMATNGSATAGGHHESRNVQDTEGQADTKDADADATDPAIAGGALSTMVTDKTSKPSSVSEDKKKKKQKKKDRPLLRIYQYNLLDAYERLPGASSSSSLYHHPDDGHVELGESGSSEDEDKGHGNSNSNSGDDKDEDEETENAKIEAHLVKSKLLAAKSLDEAITNHVVKARRRPRKKHTPYMQIILSTKRLPEYETFLRSVSTDKTTMSKGPEERIAQNRSRDYTLQLPINKKSRSRTRSKARTGTGTGTTKEKDDDDTVAG